VILIITLLVATSFGVYMFYRHKKTQKKNAEVAF